MRLACLLLICVVLWATVRETEPLGCSAPNLMRSVTCCLTSLDEYLRQHSLTTNASVESAYTILFHGTHSRGDGSDIPKTDYTKNITNLLESASRSARYGLERCLFYILRGPRQQRLNLPCHDDYDWTPDIFLASLHRI